MPTVVALFSSQAEAQSAIDALSGTPFEDMDVNVIETPAGDLGEPDAAVLPHTNDGRLSGLVTDAGGWYNSIDDETREYFIQAIRGGGVLVTADVDSEDVTEIEAFLDEHGGKTTVA
jgi:hypothetical protein